MRLHRLRVANFRGVEAREIEFADTGVTVIEGDNEAGKSSMMEAFDLLLTTQSSSKSKHVRGIQPSGRDVGTDVWADISCGAWRFEYAKRFNRQPETTLTIVEPVREQLVGREAHERVEAILAESLDKTLFGALRLLQSTDPALGDLANSAALSQALDRAAGEAESDGGESPQTQDLVAAVTAEYTKYYTLNQGRPTGELAQATDAARKAAAAVAEREAILAGVQEAADRLPRVAEAIKQLLAEERDGAVELATASAAVAEADGVGEQVKAARAVVETKQMAHRVAVDAANERTRCRERRATMAASADQTTARIAEARRLAAAATDAAAALAAEIETSSAKLGRLREDLGVAETAVVVAADRGRLTRLTATLAEVARLQRELAEAREAAAAVSVTGDDVREATALDRDITTLTARLDAASARVAVTRLGDGDVLVDGTDVDDRLEVAASELSVVEVPGVARIEIRPGADTASLATELAGVRSRETELLRRCGVPSLADVAPAANRRADALRRVNELERDLQRELAGSRPEDLERQRLDLVDRVPDGPVVEVDDPAPLRQAERDLSDLIARAERTRDAKLSEAREQSGRADALEESGARIVDEVAALDAELAASEGEIDDESLAARVIDAATALDEARAVLVKRTQRLDQLDLAGLQNTLSHVESSLERTRKQLTEQRRLRTEFVTKLDVCRADGRLDELSEAIAENDAAQAQLKRVSARAAGARVLHETLQQKRNESRARYVDPFTRRLEELAAPVFGEDVRFHVTDEFVIATRTLGGVTVDIDALSAGAKEQVGLLARLACATLIDSADGVPLILDDALGYTDPGRLTSMAQVLGTSGGDAQIIVLTCTPDRYNEVAGAKLIAV
ncbi:AAA family ATPase [Gordonia phthalatica]|uniref:Rad50/SbcC-type AAA domain-containing protein n=1 Tax=Gordonia phthalatica TaxID=1136941 RepID=A0A0N9MPX4_9ACTN|nr:ATP-binding protein [Gordonia phthalatica]ALG84305.1 hypothetical protein ACH46_07060 [Gordonia phthalatica]